jgi:hypothetical protein
LGQADWPESALIRATCNIIFGGARKDIADASSGTIALSFRVEIAGRYMANLRHELHDAIIMRRSGANWPQGHKFVPRSRSSLGNFATACAFLLCLCHGGA